MTTTPGNDDEEIAGHLRQYTALFQEQLAAAQGWPEKFEFPAPQDDAARAAFSLFLSEFEKQTGTPIKTTCEPGHA